MSTVQILSDLQDKYKKVEEYNKIIKDSTGIYILKKLKKEFEDTKIRYVEKNNEIGLIKKSFISIGRELKELQAEVDARSEQLYSKSNDAKTLEALMKNVEERKIRIKELEDYNIEMLEKEEKLKEEVEALRAQLLNLKTNFERNKQSNSEKISDANAQINELQDEILKIQKLLPQDMIYKFNNLMEAKGTAVVKLKNGVCSGCKMKVSSITLDSISSSSENIYCDNCGRILMLVKD